MPTALSSPSNMDPSWLTSRRRQQNQRGSVSAILKSLLGTKRLDLFVPGRLDSNYTIERHAEVLNEMVKERKLDHIGLSTVDVETIRRAHNVRISFLWITVSRLMP